MPINYYPNGTAKMLKHVVEQLQTPNRLHSVCGEVDTTSAAMSVSVWSPRGWKVMRSSLNFSDTSSKNYSISTMRGVGVVTGLNDRLWLKMDGKSAQQIIIPQGFYSGAELALAVAAAMDASALPDSGKPFGVTYDSSTNLFSIAPAAGSIQLFATNTCVNVRRESTAAGAIGFSTDSAKAGTITSDTEVPALGTSIVIVAGTGTNARNVVSTDEIAMTVDNALLIESSIAPVVATYEVVYKILDA